jgi:hypothetical protein
VTTRRIVRASGEHSPPVYGDLVRAVHDCGDTAALIDTDDEAVPGLCELFAAGAIVIEIESAGDREERIVAARLRASSALRRRRRGAI